MSTTVVPRPAAMGEETSRDVRRPIVVGIDASGTSVAALSWASAEAQRSRRALHVLHVQGVDLLEGAMDVLYDQVDLDVLVATAEVTVAAAVEHAREFAPSVRVTGSVVLGPAAEVLLEHSRGADLLVLGSHGRGALAQVLQGSVSQQVAAHAWCPVVVLTPEAGRVVHPPGPLSRPRTPRIVAGIDDDAPAARAVLGFAFQEASEHKAFLEVVTTWEFHRDSLATVCKGTHQAEARLINRSAHLLDEAVLPWSGKYPDVHVQRTALEGAAVPTLVHHGRGADLLVVGTRGRNGIARLLLGSVSSGIMTQACCPVAVVRPRS